MTDKGAIVAGANFLGAVIVFAFAADAAFDGGYGITATVVGFGSALLLLTSALILTDAL